MQAKNARSFRLSDLAERQLDALAAQWGTSITETLTLAIDRTWRAESFAGDASAAATVQCWQHRTSGEQYIVSVQHGQCVGAVGPISQPDRDTQILAAHTPDWECDPELADDIAADTDAYRVVWPYVSG
jgi:hypothetical protein